MCCCIKFFAEIWRDWTSGFLWFNIFFWKLTHSFQTGISFYNYVEIILWFVLLCFLVVFFLNGSLYCWLPFLNKKFPCFEGYIPSIQDNNCLGFFLSSHLSRTSCTCQSNLCSDLVHHSRSTHRFKSAEPYRFLLVLQRFFVNSYLASNLNGSKNPMGLMWKSWHTKIWNLLWNWVELIRQWLKFTKIKWLFIQFNE